jgi:hypothetical protein
MRTESGLSTGLSDTIGGDGELALDREGRSGVVEHAPRATRSAANVRGNSWRGGRCPAMPRTLSANAVFVGSSWARYEVRAECCVSFAARSPRPSRRTARPTDGSRLGRQT